MKNLNKFTKAELIKNLKRIEDENSNKNLIFKIVDYILYFKSIIIKITLIGFIIKWIKKYSLVKKLWHIFSAIGSTLLGFSLIDIYSWDVINWLQDTSIYKWFYELVSKKELSNSSKNGINIHERINANANEIQEKIERNRRNIEENQLEILSNKEYNSLEEKNNYKKYIIIGSLIIIGGVVWYYWNDIKPGDAANGIVDKIKSFRSWFKSDESNIIDNNSGNNQTDIQTNIDQNIQSEDSNIQLEDNTSTPGVLTSPSLENLNEQAESSWGEGQSSPGSSSSGSSTIGPSSPKSSTTIESTSEPSSSSSSVSPSSSSVTKIFQNHWRIMLTDDVNDKINFVESTLDKNNLSRVSYDTGINLVHYFLYIVNEYNKNVESYEEIVRMGNSDNVIKLKALCFYHRSWISKYLNLVFPDINTTIEIGTINDVPKILTKNIF